MDLKPHFPHFTVAKSYKEEITNAAKDVVKWAGLPIVGGSWIHWARCTLTDLNNVHLFDPVNAHLQTYFKVISLTYKHHCCSIF